MKGLVTALYILITTIAISPHVLAEGVVSTPTDKGGGPYRRVRTQAIGYRAIMAEFTVPAIFLPTDTSAKSSPSFYVGGGSNSANGNVEVDAGVYWEFHAFPTVDPGWAVFARVARGPHPDTVNPSPAWRSNSTTNPNVTSFVLTWVFTPSDEGYLKVQAFGADVSPDVLFASDGNTIINGQNGLFVKRVIAVSQGQDLTRGTYQEDGTYMRGCVVRNVLVTTDTSMWCWEYFPWQEWSAMYANTDQSYTGYSPDGKDKHIGNTGRHGSGARYIVDFPTFTEAQRNSVFASRYDTEQVDINLERNVRVKGNAITPASR